ncbi:hypothetical protein BGZ99_005753 [Dissophora globulifera]|uniref:glycogenin glucosyltransferase n=1 Tax=Dissophora globulifera TaxID=979702 RepID=A0A9P6USX6_9FUNG|nr:hypothetical protein BGZ99_005753 [Dissophora globulifera]
MEAFITLLTNNNYASGALVLAHSLRACHTSKTLAVLVTATVSRSIRDRLAQVYDAVIEIGEIDSRSTKNLALLGRPELGVTLTKIHVFNQTQYSKVVFLDADTLVLRNIDELFDFAANGSLDDPDRNTRFAAAPDAGWPDCFNSGVFVCRPKYEDYVGLIEMAGQHGTFDGGDQGLLNSYFDGWSRGDSSNRLPFVYNTTPSSVYSYAPAFQQYKDKLAVIHFVGSFKPWQWLRFADGEVFPRNTSSTDSIALVQKWWNVFDNFIGGKPSDIHEVTHDYSLPPQSQWDHVGMDLRTHEPPVEKQPHYDGWFKPYDHQNQNQQPPAHSHGHHHEQQQREEHHDQQREGNTSDHPSGSDKGHPTEQEYRHDEHWRPPIPPRVADRIEWHNEHHGRHNETHRENHHEHHQAHHQESQYAHNPHQLTDYHYQPPPSPPKIPDLPEPDFHRYDANGNADGHDERQTHHRSHSSGSSIDREINPHHLTDYRYRLPITIDSPNNGGGGTTFNAIIPEPVGLPNMYYPNAWDLPEDPRKAHPQIKVTPLVIEDTTNKDNTSVPSGKGKPVFPWETSGPNTPKSPRTPSRAYYNYMATKEERWHEKELEEARRLEFEEQVLEQIRNNEYARYELERKRQEELEKATGGQAFENFRLVNAWDVDVGIQMSILQKTEKRRPRSRKSSAGGIRKGYGLEDMLAYEVRQRQMQYEADLVQKRLEEEERWQKEQEEARIKEEEMRLEKARLAKLAKLKAEQRQRGQDSSMYAFRNAWDPPGLSSTKKKLRIEDEEVGLALHLRQEKRSAFDDFKTAGAGAIGESSTRATTVTRTSTHGVPFTTAAAAGAGAAGLAIAAVSLSGHVERPKHLSAGEATLDFIQHGAQVGQTVKGSTEHSTTLSGAASTASASLLEEHSLTEGEATATTTTSNTKITRPGSHRFVKTTVTTNITRRKFMNGVEVSSDTSSGTTSGERMFEIPAGPRTGSYFGNATRRTVTTSDSQGTSRLTSAASTGGTHTSQSSFTSGENTKAVTSAFKVETATTGSHQAMERPGTSSHLRKVGERATTTTTTTVMSRIGGQTSAEEDSTTNVTESGSALTASAVSKSKSKATADLQVITNPTMERYGTEGFSLDVEDQQRRLDLRGDKASVEAAAEAMEVLAKYPQATRQYGALQASTSSITNTSNKHSTRTALFASDPNLPRPSAAASSSDIKDKALKALRIRSTFSSDEDNLVYQDEDIDELEYFGESHTRATLPPGSPYMPSTPLGLSGTKYGASASGFSSRAVSRAGSRPGSRPTTPGPVTPSRFGQVSKRLFEFKQPPEKIAGPSTTQQTGPVDTGFSNYKIEWNWKELLGKKPRHWTAEAGEEYYDPYNALSTHGSLADSDEDDGRILESSDEDSEEEAVAAATARRAKSGGESSSSHGVAASSSLSSSSSSSAFPTGEEREFTHESDFVIRGGKIARRRSSMALDHALKQD